jgi:2-hydroxychromene-2-carboxylate isomerase
MPNTRRIYCPYRHGVAERALFVYDLGSPYAYLSAERINAVFNEAALEVPEWQPVLLGGLFKEFGRSSWGLGLEREEGMRECERRASAYGLPPFVWPEGWPSNYLFAMRVATYAKQLGKTVSFSLAAFRQQFAAGRDLSDPQNVMIAAAAAEIHPRAIERAVQLESVRTGLRDATAAMAARDVRGVPALVVGGRVFWGDDRLEEAVAAAANSVE